MNKLRTCVPTLYSDKIRISKLSVYFQFHCAHFAQSILSSKLISMPPSLLITFLQVSVVATVISDINIVDNISYEVVDADFSDRKFEMMFTVKVSIAIIIYCSQENYSLNYRQGKQLCTTEEYA